MGIIEIRFETEHKLTATDLRNLHEFIEQFCEDRCLELKNKHIYFANKDIFWLKGE